MSISFTITLYLLSVVPLPPLLTGWGWVGSRQVNLLAKCKTEMVAINICSNAHWLVETNMLGGIGSVGEELGACILQ